MKMRPGRIANQDFISRESFDPFTTGSARAKTRLAESLRGERECVEIGGSPNAKYAVFGAILCQRFLARNLLGRGNFSFQAAPMPLSAGALFLF